ncbi:hypothetical protein NHQ30_003971 [Ciborinia camelliae]|nr:hypothetical protein NHQ30_003971 [Ciborinia camelliae]
MVKAKIMSQSDRDHRSAQISFEFGLPMPYIMDRMMNCEISHTNLTSLLPRKFCDRLFQTYFSSLARIIPVIDQQKFLADYNAHYVSPYDNDLFYFQTRAILAIISPIYFGQFNGKDMAFEVWWRMRKTTIDDYPGRELEYLQTRILTHLARVNVGCNLISLFKGSEELVKEANNIASKLDQKVDQTLKLKLFMIILNLHMQSSLVVYNPFGDDWELLKSNHECIAVPPPACFKASWEFDYSPMDSDKAFEEVLNGHWIAHLTAGLQLYQWESFDNYTKWVRIQAAMYLNRSTRHALQRRYEFVTSVNNDEPTTISDAAIVKIYDHRLACFTDIKYYLELMSVKEMQGHLRLFYVMFQYDIAEANAFLELKNSDLWKQSGLPPQSASSSGSNVASMENNGLSTNLNINQANRQVDQSLVAPAASTLPSDGNHMTSTKQQVNQNRGKKVRYPSLPNGMQTESWPPLVRSNSSSTQSPHTATNSDSEPIRAVLKIRTLQEN